MSTYLVKAGDTAPRPRTQLLDGANNPVPITGAAVRFKARRGPDVAPVIDAVATIVDAPTGIVEYALQAADTVAPADLQAEWQVTFAGGAIQTFPGEGYDRLLITADLDQPITSGGTGYATRAQARAAGAVGTDAEIDAAVATAEQRVDRYTGQRWQPTVMTVLGRITGKGIVVLPRQIDPTQAVAVRPLGATTDLPASSYQVTSSRTPGGIDALWLGHGLSDITVNGAEPYAGGWPALLPRTGMVQVTATFGTATTPYEVVRATGLIAASVLAGGPTDTPAGPSVNDEGETLAVQAGPVATQGVADTSPLRTTGVPAADALLAPLAHRAVRLSGV